MLGVIRFKLLQKKKTTLTLSFVPTSSMPLSKNGIYLFDTDGKLIDNYTTIHSVVFTEIGNNSSSEALEEIKINSVTAKDAYGRTVTKNSAEIVVPNK